MAETAGLCHRTGTLMGSGDGGDMSCDDRSVMGSSDGNDGNTGTLT